MNIVSAFSLQLLSGH